MACFFSVSGVRNYQPRRGTRRGSQQRNLEEVVAVIIRRAEIRKKVLLYKDGEE